ncbi:MAG: septation protein IspZ, partial [Gammaproteobacteria bacterium]
RNHHLRHVSAAGRTLEVDVGFVNLIAPGIAVHQDGVLVHESHPGRPLNVLDRAYQGPGPAATADERANRQAEAEAQWQRNKPSLFVDIALGLLFFAVGRITGDLTTAALVGAGAGLAVVVAQRFVRADLLGGLAVFGVFTLLLSAAFSLAFQDERMVQLKGTILGLVIATIILSDALFNRGRYFGERMKRYLQGMTVDARRLSLGIALLTLTMAGLNLLATLVLTEENWLFYTTFIDTPLGVALGFGVFRFAQAR